jgi:uncharacterized OsmC-like protein
MNMNPPIGFLVSPDQSLGGFDAPPPGHRRLLADCRMLDGHQKEALVSDNGHSPCTWRFLSDEGKHLKGADEAPFPLGFFNAGLTTDLLSHADAHTRSACGDTLTLVNHYWMTGSFAKGDGQGYAAPPTLEVKATNPADRGRLAEGLAVAAQSSPAFRALANEVAATFSLFVNGRRIALTELTESDSPPTDPFQRHTAAPRPAAGVAFPEIIRKTTVVEAGEVRPAPVGTTTRIIRNVTGRARVERSEISTDTWLELPGVSHFELRAALEGEVDRQQLPTGLAYLASGVAFCFMTQLSRYIEHKKFLVDGLRLSQVWDFPADQKDGSGRIATHLFLNSKDSDVRCEELMRIAVRTCYLHATLQTPLQPDIQID